MRGPAPIPVTVLTGFLGAGKTTLLHRLLSDPASPPTAVIVNEFGALGIDGALIAGGASGGGRLGVKDRLIELQNGCVCCELRGDLRDAITDLLAKRARPAWQLWSRPLRFDRILIETSGLAAPGPVVQTLLLDPHLAAHTRADGVIAVAHAAKIREQLLLHPEAQAQIACADRVLLNHDDRLSPGDPERALALDDLRALAPHAEITRCAHADTPVAPLLDLGGADPVRWRMDGSARHASGVTTQALSAPSPLDLPRLKMFLQFLAARRGPELLRLKGIFRCTSVPTAVVAQGVHQWLELGPHPMPPPDHSRLVVIGRGLDTGEVERGWRAIL